MRMTINNIALGEGSDVEACEADSHVGGCSDKMVKHENRDICGVLVPQWFGLPVQPFSVADFNSMLVPFGTPAVDGKYLCPSKANISQVCLRLRAFSSRGGKALECSSSGRPCRVRWCFILSAPVRNSQQQCHDKELRLRCFHWRCPKETWGISMVCYSSKMPHSTQQERRKT